MYISIKIKNKQNFDNNQNLTEGVLLRASHTCGVRSTEMSGCSLCSPSAVTEIQLPSPGAG